MASAYWQMFDAEYLAFSRVVACRDGGRFYLEYAVDDTTPEHVEKLYVDPLAPDQQTPSSVPRSFGWDEDTAYLLEEIKAP
jgi:hypothetical protein